MKNLNILHISDAHIQRKDEEEIKEIVRKLIRDVKKVQTEKNIFIDLVCFTGDLIQCGKKALGDEKQWELGMEILINPLLEQLNLSLDRFVFVPGNHEVNTDEIIYGLEKGLQVESQKDINQIMAQFDQSYKKRLSYFYDIIAKHEADVFFGQLGYCYRKFINELEVGIVCVDSAWRSSGKGYAEKGKIYVGMSQIQELFRKIQDCDIKICMMHHPIDWLEDCERFEIGKELAEFDIVLRGHVHKEDLEQVIRNKLKTVYSTAGKLYPICNKDGQAIDGFNGYSILNIDYSHCRCNIYVRSYYGENRKEFDRGLNICPDGEASYDICIRNNEWKMEYNVIEGINKYFRNMSEKYALIKEVDPQSPKDFLQILIDPVLAEQSEYVKENGDSRKEITIKEIISSSDNFLLIGKKESGKTTILQQVGLGYTETYEKRGMIPIYINMKYLPKKSDRILNSAIRFIQENIFDEVSISKQQIKQIFDEGRAVFLIDNVKTNSADHTIWLSTFIKEYGTNRFILTLEEEFFQSLDVKKIPSYGEGFKELYIQYLGKAQIRELVTKWAEGRNGIDNIDETVERIDSYCNQINFAKTPFNIAVFMVLWDNDNSFIPVNEGIVMENYLEIVLEKLSAKESYRTTYAFKIKQDFLSYIAYNMYEKDEYYFSCEEFERIVIAYHEKKGYNLAQSKFDKIFFDKNILTYLGDNIVFSHTSFLEYFLALYALNNKDFLDEIVSPGRRIYFKNEICFYAGLNQNCIELLDNLSDAILDIVVENLNLVEELNDMQIVADFKIEKEKFIQDIQKNRMSQEELDEVNDKYKTYQEINPKEINKKEKEEQFTEEDVKEVAEDFLTLLQMYGSVIKNAELLDNNYKIVHFENYMYGMNMLYAIVVKFTEYFKEKLEIEGLTSEEKVNVVDVAKMIFAIAFQNIILENIGTPKLESAINQLIKSKQNQPFEKFMLTFLKCDLKIENLKSALNKYIREEKSDSILKMMLVKLTFYYRMRFFGNNVKIEKDIIDLITEIYLKLNSNNKLKLASIKGTLAKHIKFQMDN